MIRPIIILPTFLAMAAVLWAAAGFAQTPAIKSYPNWVRPRLVGKASNAGDFWLDEKKLRSLCSEFVWTADQLKYLDEQLRVGDSRGAIVASLDPLIVSAYSDELDAVILIRFPDELAKTYSLNVGSRLIASWIYPNLTKPPGDVALGKFNSRRYNNGAPIVADFFGGPPERIAKRKATVSEREWLRAIVLTPTAMQRAHGEYRSAFPLDTWRPPVALQPAPAAK